MNLDNASQFSELDASNMLGAIQELPDQLLKAWETANRLPLPEKKNFSRIIVAGMGGSAIGADILASYIFNQCNVPLTILRGYQLPAWASGPDDLVICSSHSGNTEETLAVFQEALNKKCTLMAVSTGGHLTELATENNCVAWVFNHKGQPRAAVGYSFGLLLNLFTRLNLIPEQSGEVDKAVSEMRILLGEIDADIPVTKNLAKRIAGQAVGRIPVVFGTEFLEPVARRWKTQWNEIGKCPAQFEFLPEADHNTLAGLVCPEELVYKTYAVFLTSGRYQERNQKRHELTAETFMVSGACIDKIICSGSTKLAEIWKTILLGDLISFYTAMLYEVDPTPVEALEDFKRAMKKQI